MAEKRPRPPADLVRRGPGRAFWAEVVATHELELHEVRLLAEICRTLDELGALREAILADGVVVAGSKGQRRQHPALTELRGLRAELRHLLTALDLEVEDDDGTGLSITSRRAQHAARQRWGSHSGARARG